MTLSSGAIRAGGAQGPRKADAYLFAAFTLAALIASISIVVRDATLARGAATAFAPSLLFGVFAVAARYPSRAMPLESTRWALLAGVHVAGAVAAAFLWALSWRSWGRILAAAGEGAAPMRGGELAAPIGTGILLYLIAVIAQYLLIEIERSDAARQAALRSELAAREAELKAFKAQIDPHFLFNSLNAIASLCGSRPGDARIMAQRLADFFRLTLRLGKRERIRLEEEIELARKYLDIEQTRFGPRFESGISSSPAATACGVPPLLLQPLVENAVRHGIAGVVAGGMIRIEASVLRRAAEDPSRESRRSRPPRQPRGRDRPRERPRAARGELPRGARLSSRARAMACSKPSSRWKRSR